MSFWVYILRCADGSYYTGHTDNLEKRIQEHHAGAIAGCYTFKRRPVQLAFSQDFPTRIEALTSEQQIKGWSRKKKEAMMRGDWAEVSRLAKSSNACRADNTVQAELLDDDCPESSDAVRPEPKAVSLSNGRMVERAKERTVSKSGKQHRFALKSPEQISPNPSTPFVLSKVSPLREAWRYQETGKGLPLWSILIEPFQQRPNKHWCYVPVV